ncbi:MAG: hypothetical protein AB7E80_08880 [Hyphomicrobiaceae bacterium]
MNGFYDAIEQPEAYAWVLRDGEIYLALEDGSEIDAIEAPAASKPEVKACGNRCKRATCAGSCKFAASALGDLSLALGVVR